MIARIVIPLLTLILAHAAQAAPLKWKSALSVQVQAGPENPLVLSGFNPQPEPPARWAGGTLGVSFAFAEILGGDRVGATVRIRDDAGGTLGLSAGSAPGDPPAPGGGASGREAVRSRPFGPESGAAIGRRRAKRPRKKPPALHGPGA